MCGSNACCPDVTSLGDIVKDEICGTFNIPCSKEGTAVTVWELDTATFTFGAQSAASISIFYEQGCDDELTALVTKIDGSTTVLNVAKLNTRAITVIDAVSLKIVCEEKVTPSPLKYCRGKFCISLHYDVLVARI